MSNKDEGGGSWKSEEVGILSWSATSENLFCDEGAGKTYADLFDLMVAKTPIAAVFSLRNEAESVTNVPSNGWTPKVPKYTGNVVITSLSLNAPNGEYATFTANFSGVGALTKVTSGS